MRILPRFKSFSRVVHEEQLERQEEEKTYPRTEGTLCTSLTVWRKSLVISCEGFTVFDSDGNLVYRVDNYIERPEEVTLMDASGRSVLTIRRRRVLILSLFLFPSTGRCAIKMVLEHFVVILVIHY